MFLEDLECMEGILSQLQLASDGMGLVWGLWERISVTECQRSWVMPRWCENIAWWWWDNLARLESELRFCDLGWCSVVVLIRVWLVVCKIMSEDWDGTLEHERSFKGGRWIVYEERLLDVGWFPFLFSLLLLMYSKALHDFEIASTLVLFSQYVQKFCLDSNITLLIPKSPMPNPTHYKYLNTVWHTNIQFLTAFHLKVNTLTGEATLQSQLVTLNL